MPTSNFLIFDQNKANMIGDEAYQTSTQRLNGVQSGVASSMLNNKFAYQVSLVAYAIAQIMNQNGIDATDTMAVSQFVNNLSSTFLQKVVDKASVEDAIAASSDSKWMSPKTVKSMLQHMGSGWQLLEKWEVAGTYTWTAPDLLGNGQPYEIGILLIGGGGSGGCYGLNSTTSAAHEWAVGATPGISRNFILEVTPGQNYPIKIGTGGEKSTLVMTASSGYSSGNNGSETTFQNFVSQGGLKGLIIGSVSNWNAITQFFNMRIPVSLLPNTNYADETQKATFGGEFPDLRVDDINSYSELYSLMKMIFPFSCFNFFAGKRILSTSCYAHAVSKYSQTSQGGTSETEYPAVDDTGNSCGGASRCNSILLGEMDGLLPGCPGGSNLSLQLNSQQTVIGGKGHDGACYIYATFMK